MPNPHPDTPESAETSAAEPQAVRVRVADYDPHYRPEKALDERQFSALPQWLIDFGRAGFLHPHQAGHDDHAEWHVMSGGIVLNAEPGDWIIRRADGSLYVVPRDVAALREVATVPAEVQHLCQVARDFVRAHSIGAAVLSDTGYGFAAAFAKAVADMDAGR